MLSSPAPTNQAATFLALYAGRVSLSAARLGVAISFLLGMVIGDGSGYVDGPVDTMIQRIIESRSAFPPCRSGWA